MKLYSEYPNASISMSTSADFVDALSEVFASGKCLSILETGTYKGLGSTKVIADIVDRKKVNLNYFYTLEVDKTFYTEALKNLSLYPFVQVLWGMSVNKKEAIRFINNDEILDNHETILDVYIDVLNNPKLFYINEINGNLSNSHTNYFKKIINIFTQSYPMENCFRRIIPILREDNPLFVLDSSGGIGYLEFNLVKELMGNKSYYLVLDDVHHLKHFRSLIDIKKDKKFEILCENLEHGWVIAKYL